MSSLFYINEDIKMAESLPAIFYTDPTIFAELREKVFLKSWQFIGDDRLVPVNKHAHPLTFMEQLLDEPVVLVKEEEEIKCFSNVCTHRGNLVVQHPGVLRFLQCAYHGRKFNLSGKFEFMPEFKEALDFPRPCEDLKQFHVRQWAQFLFASLEPAFDFNQVIEQMMERTYFLPLDQFKRRPSRSKDYLVEAHWALYCDNFLEGFHIPFVHNELNEGLDYGQYKTEIYEHCNLQIGYTDEAIDTFDFPKGHPDFGKNVAAYYYWIFPNLMFNFYPWGLSINIVKPISEKRTRVSFISYVYDESKMDSGAGAILDKVEREDEMVVEGVQKGLRSRYYNRGRFSPKREQGVHHFHRLLSLALT